MTAVRWIRGSVVHRCPLCRDEASKEQVVQVAVPGTQERVTVSRCNGCRSMVITGHLLADVTPSDEAIDWYVQQSAGIETIFERLAPFQRSGVVRFADVGCNFGFGVDIASRLFGWDAEGFDPSPAAARGHLELTSRVRREPLTAATAVASPFDLMLASEVIEHVEDPVAFLEGVLPHLRPEGVLVLTTPSADAVRPDAALASLLPAISPGHHRFLASSRALTGVLRSVGLNHLDVRDDGGTIVVVASRAGSPFVCDAPGDAPVAQVVDYLDRLADASDVAPGVRLGASARHAKQLVLRGRLDDVPPSRARLDRHLAEQHGFTLDDLAEVARRSELGERLPWFVVGNLFADGMYELQRGSARAASARFDVAATTWQHLDRRLDGALDLETAHLGLMAAAHRLLSLAQSEPAEVPAEAARVEALAVACSPRERGEIARLTAAAFSGLVAAGEYVPAERLLPRVEPILDGLLGGDPNARRAGLDALFCRAMLALQRGEPALARRTFLRCCDETAHDDDAHAAGLLREAARHADISAEHVRANTARGGVVHDLDVYWADAGGIYVQGFAFVPGAPASEITLRWGAATCAGAGPGPHAGAAAMHPDDPAAAASGFRGHLAGPLTDRLVVELTTAHGRRTIDVALPAHPLPPWPGEADPDTVRASLCDALRRHAPAGRAVALGVRGHDDSALANWRDDLPGREVLGIDVHPGPGVDLVGDAHVMSSFVEPASVAIFVCDAVFEHLEAPWLVAAEVARILVPGGLALVSAPSVWPEHAVPNDFWRMSADGLRSLFGPALGFTVLSSGGFGNVSVGPGPLMRSAHGSMPVHYGPSTSYVLARKDADLPADVVRWPYDASGGRERALQYPVQGVETGGVR